MACEFAQRGRRIEDADARPPHHRLEFMRLGSTECWLWFSPGLRQDFTQTLLEFGDGVTMGRPSNHPPEGKFDPRKVKNRCLIVWGTPKSNPRAPKMTIFVFFETFQQIRKHVRSRSGPRAPKSAQEYPKSTPRALRKGSGRQFGIPKRVKIESRA